MSDKKLVREIASIIASHDSKDQYGNAKLAEYIIRKIQRTLTQRAVDLPQLCAQCNANHGDMSCAEYQALSAASH